MVAVFPPMVGDGGTGAKFQVGWAGPRGHAVEGGGTSRFFGQASLKRQGACPPRSLARRSAMEGNAPPAGQRHHQNVRQSGVVMVPCPRS